MCGKIGIGEEWNYFLLENHSNYVHKCISVNHVSPAKFLNLTAQMHRLQLVTTTTPECGPVRPGSADQFQIWTDGFTTSDPDRFIFRFSPDFLSF